MLHKLKSSSVQARSPSKQESIFAQSFEIIPAEVVFKDIEVNQYYEITVQIRNLTNGAKRIRFQKPENPNFKVIYAMQPQIASGLSTTAKIKYECKELKNQTEIIKVISEQGLTVQLPVRVYKMESQILFEPFVDMGFLKIGKQHEQKIAIKNNGKAAGTIEFSHEHGPLLTVEPKILKISPQEQSSISVKYKPTEAGLFKGQIKLKSESILVKDSIDIHATSVEHSRYIIDDKNNQTFSFDFGTMFVGEESVIKAFVVNNSPKRMMFKTVFRKGSLVSAQEFVNVQTPSEIGSEQSERVMFMQPQAASIEAFQELQIKFYCKTKVSYRDRVFTKSYALTPPQHEGAINHKKNSNEFKPENIYEYSILLASEGDEPIIMQLKANAICPQIKLQQDLFQFGDCPVKDSRQLNFNLENRNPSSRVDISFQKIPNFTIVPPSYSLKPAETVTFKLIFQPKTIGKIDSIQKLLINKIYDIELRCFGIATSEESRSRKRIESIRQSPQLRNTLKQSDFKTRGKALSVAEKTFVSQIRKSTQQAETAKLQLESIRGNKGLYNKFLIERRSQRMDKQKESQLQKKWSLYQSKLQDLGAGGKYDEKLDEEGIPTNTPIDYEFETGVNETRIKRQTIALPASKERLYVTKHIADYQPLPVSHSSTVKFNRSIMQPPKKLHIEVPVNFNHKREVSSELTPEELSSIEVATNSINFGDVYIKSKQSRYFWIKNGTKKAISVSLKIAETELAHSYKKSQVVQSGSEAAFEIVFCKDTLGDFKASIKYVINGLHEFELSVLAKSVPVEIEIDRTNLKFQFDSTSLEMSTSESVTLYNSGNSNAFFKFILNKQRLFTPKVLEGTLKSKEKLSIPITLAVPVPAVKKNEYNFTERIIMKVLDGNQITLTCNFSAADPKYTTKCEVFNAAPTLCIGHQLQEFFEIKNTSKLPIVFHIEGSGGILINEKIKLSPEEARKLKIRFMGKQIGKFNCAITITPRCGQKKVLETVISVVEPNILFSHETLQMGVLVVQGIAGVADFTLTNKSTIELPLVIDIRSRKLKNDNPEFIEYLKLLLLDEEQQLEVLGMTQKTEEHPYEVANEGENLVGLQINEDEFDNSESDQQKLPEKNQDEQRRYKLLLKPDKQYKFQAEFSPKEAGSFSIDIPMFIEKSGRIVNTPAVSCESINPQFIFEPSVIDFKRKIVTKPDRCYPKFIPVRISNIDDEDVEWEVKDEEIKKEGIFNIQVTQGVLKAKQNLQFKVSFNPYTVGQYNHRLPLYIKSAKLKEPLKYVDIVLLGTSSLPMLYFNKREIMMPVVPLDIETTSSFRVINDGYENCNLKYQFLDDVANIGVQLSYPEGLNIGITKQKIKVDLSWKFSKPISFTLKLQFTDDMNRTFTIPVSGTADNCIFSNYTYILRNEHKLTIKMENALQLIEAPEPQPTGGLQRRNSAHSLKSSQTNKSVLSYLGVAPISPAILSNTIDYITRYLNSNLLTIPITSFPGSLIETDGAPLFQILSFVSNKNTNFPWRFTGNEKGLARVQKIYQQYNELVKMLKVEGAQLNHIRPEYLMSYSDLNQHLANLPAQKSKYFMPSLLKITSGLYNYLSMQSWITLLYQIFKIYVLARVTPKNYKLHLSSAPEIPPQYLSQSNFTSVSENILFFWAEQAVNEVLLEERRLTNFDKDFKDGTVIACLLQKYANVTLLKKMKMICTNEEDYKENATVLCEQLAEIGLQNHITPKDFIHPLQREMLLFLLHLYVYLPFYTPKADPIVFKCVLGQEVTRTIQLNNPSNKPVNYLVKYEGCEDFKIINKQPFRIEPRQTYKFEVRFVSRVSAPVKGRIMFINIKEKSLTAAALVFELKSEITGRVSDRIWNVSGLLYEQIEFPIEVANKFSSTQLVDFAITYQTEYIFEAKLLKTKNGAVPLPKDQQIQTIYGKADNIKIRKNSSATLTLNYVPLSMFTTRTTIFFVSNIVGEFQHQIIATVEPPAVTAEIRPPMTLSVDQIANWEYPINPKNDMIVRAKKAIDSLKKTKKGSIATLQQNKTTADAYTSETFTIEIGANPYVNAKENITITDKPANEKAKESNDPKKKDSLKGDNTEISSSENKIPFTIICKNPVYEFSTYILLSNKSRTDVRRYRIVFTIQPKPLKAILEMNVPARSEVTQNLPIVNNTERDWNIKITWQPDPAKNGNYFIINPAFASSFPVKRNSIGNFPITFKPKWAYPAEAKLIMSNPLTLDNFQYQITGNGEEPVAEEHIQIKCEAKQLVKKELIIKNPYQEKPINLRVETDLLNCQSAKKLTIPSGGKQKFEFTVHPMLCGEYTGSITFYEEQGPQYIWYTISIVTNYPVALKTMNIESEIRKKHIQKIEVPYDGDKENAYQVIINGVGLSGYSSISLKPGTVNIYQLEYLPLEVGEEKGSICFINPEIGEILYEFDLKCTPRPVTTINNIKSPLGVSTFVEAELQNPTNSKVVIKVVNTNPEQFALKSNLIKLAPFQIRRVEIEYIPASLDNIENANLKFTSKEIGDWEYELSGMGLSPIPFPPYIVYNGLLEEHSDSVKFRNPFKYDITVGVKMVWLTTADERVFHLLNTSKSKFQIESFSMLEIPFSFIPNGCRMYECKILVMISEKIFWTFPIKGITEINEGKTIANLTAQCRTTTTEYVQLPLDGIQNFKQNNNYEFKLENVPQHYAPLIDKFLIIECTKKSLNHAKDTLEFQFLFKPMKPGKAMFDFLVMREQGSRWRFRVQVEGTEPEPDDVIEIESGLLITSTINFKMTNSDKTSAQFKAKFTSDSAHEFSVQPKEGVLAKFGSKGTNFYISFTPVEYGKEKKGKLIIETSQMYWSYLLKGSLPKYVPPKLQAGSRARVSSEKK